MIRFPLTIFQPRDCESGTRVNRGERRGELMGTISVFTAVHQNNLVGYFPESKIQFSTAVIQQFFPRGSINMNRLPSGETS